MPAPSRNTSIFVALAILRHADGIVLVQQLAPDGYAYWTVPGGMVEAGELVSEALVREAREEAGVTVTALGRMASFSQIDQPADAMQTIALVFDVEAWHGELGVDDPDGEVLAVELVPLGAALERLEANGGWPGIQAPLRAYLRGEAPAGTLSFYREGTGGFASQQLITRLEGSGGRP